LMSKITRKPYYLKTPIQNNQKCMAENNREIIHSKQP
jgi:hypothetical protein